MEASPINAAARRFHENMRDLQAGRVTVDEARAINRQLRESLSELDWQRAKATAVNQL